MQNNNGADIFWNVLLTIGGIFGVVNFIVAFRRKEVSEDDRFEEYERIIADKDRIIETLERRVSQYQKIIRDDNRSNSKLE